ncbi:hypothetical protein BAE44_0011733 [Dichanthelium oligosanthes]|uniref:23 kDa jasmonate-induced protein-like n=1 Tax=Dichanthelium oligosanthes TaxID=888268 RepID=A0A1E5VQ81_9POAL|nr:hypothetical protein BAE44_0011733 [Dichanthelium oligosanthes]
MANCFGDVVDNFKLDTMPRYVGRPKTREDRAREATALVNDDGKYQKAIDYVRGLKSWWGNGVSTLCLIYNETGDTLRFVEDHDWWGYMGPTPYPTEIGNGQWASFLHVKKTSASSGSQAGVVYRGKDSKGNERDFLICWSSPWAAWYSNTAYCEIGNPGAFTSRWNTIYGSVNNAKGSWSADTGNCSVHTTIGEHSSSFFTAYVAIPFGP